MAEIRPKTNHYLLRSNLDPTLLLISDEITYFGPLLSRFDIFLKNGLNLDLITVWSKWSKNHLLRPKLALPLIIYYDLN
jgi:hypothetical protein